MSKFFLKLLAELELTTYDGKLGLFCIWTILGVKYYIRIGLCHD